MKALVECVCFGLCVMFSRKRFILIELPLLTVPYWWTVDGQKLTISKTKIKELWLIPSVHRYNEMYYHRRQIWTVLYPYVLWKRPLRAEELLQKANTYFTWPNSPEYQIFYLYRLIHSRFRFHLDSLVLDSYQGHRLSCRLLMYLSFYRERTKRPASISSSNRSMKPQQLQQWRT